MSDKLEWLDSYSIKIDEIDAQHKKLLSIANELYDLACGEETNYKNGVSKALKKLTDYTEYHFSYEEGFQKKYGYPQLDFHKMQHDQFIQQVNSQIQKLSTPNAEDGIVFYDFLVKWVLNHIAKSDKVWADFVLTKMNG